MPGVTAGGEKGGGGTISRPKGKRLESSNDLKKTWPDGRRKKEKRLFPIAARI